jgi:hypothetical protein
MEQRAIAWTSVMALSSGYALRKQINVPYFAVARSAMMAADVPEYDPRTTFTGRERKTAAVKAREIM